MIKLKSLIVNLLITLGGGALIAFLTRDSMDVYGNLQQPPLSPPGIIFPIVWTILYFLMAISAYMITESKSTIKKKALTIYGIQLFLNFIWPLIFFNARMFLLALLVLIALWVMVLWMIGTFYRINPRAAFLQIPYALWLTFAAYLNLGVWVLNM